MIWTEESARLLARAYRAGGAAQALADRIAPLLEPGAHVCDAGCGVGSLSMALCQRGFRVTAVDIDATALAQLKRDANPAALGRMEICCRDARTLAPKTPYDAMVFCFYGDIRNCLRLSRRLCGGDVFYISRNYDMHRFSVGAHRVRYSGYQDARQTLDRLGIPYEASEFALDMSQPFVSLEEARRFFALYSLDDPALVTDAFLRGRLRETPQGEYPLLLAHLREAGMVHFKAKDIPAELTAME